MSERIELTDEERDNGITNAWHCERCNARIDRYRGTDDQVCNCGAIYNCFGQRLRNDLYSRPNPSEYDENIGDMEGYEMAMSYDDYMYGGA